MRRLAKTSVVGSSKGNVNGSNSEELSRAIDGLVGIRERIGVSPIWFGPYKAIGGASWKHKRIMKIGFRGYSIRAIIK